MPRIGFDSMTQAFERAKTVHALDRAAAVPELRWLVADYAPRRPGFEPRTSRVGFVVDKVTLSSSSSSALVSPVNSHSTDRSTFIIYHPGLVQ
jgi:hypothetical protein